MACLLLPCFYLVLNFFPITCQPHMLAQLISLNFECPLSRLSLFDPLLLQDLITMIQERTGLKNTNIETVWSVYDTLFCEARHNMTAPDWVTPNIMDDLRKLKDFGFEIMFEVYKHQEKSRLQGGNANCQNGKGRNLF
ncbi:unnamed protein product [Oncorhynchus mykiss]|uniref:Uncharacterized protein n=1 Tax=Oncorhynchus mykiss TaxID=8022 RepID=A0A060Z5T7_ONCMY|nr:unnamed protein product [Oncorhynchus mykiss]